MVTRISRLSKTCALSISIVLLASVARGEVLFEDVDRAVRQGVAFLKQQQNAKTGEWNGFESQAAGVGALCTLALLKSGVDLNEPAVANALRALRSHTDLKTSYAVALQTLALCAAEPGYDAMLVQQNVDWLEKAQGDKRGDGAWSYSGSASVHDGSNTQFAILALYEAQQAGAQVAPATWQRAAAYYRDRQNPDGSWGYLPSANGSGSMTCAALSGLAIIRQCLPAGDPALQGCDEALARGERWLVQHFSVHGNPPEIANGLLSFYYLHALAQFGHYSGRCFLGRHAWWKEGARLLLDSQNKDGSWTHKNAAEEPPIIATSLALLFLAESPRRPDLGASNSPRRGRPMEPRTPSENDLADMASGKLRQFIPIIPFDGFCLQFSPDSRLLASCGLTRFARLWEMTGKLTRELPMSPLIGNPTFSPDGKSVALVDVNLPGEVVLWSVSGKDRPRAFDLPGAHLRYPSFSRDGRLLMALADPQGVVIWNLGSGRPSAVFKSGGDPIEALFSPDGKTAAVVSWEKGTASRSVQLWDIGTERERAVLHADFDVSPLAFSPDGKTLAAASKDHSVLLFDAVAGKLRATCRGHLQTVHYLDFSPDGKLLASAGNDRFIELWDALRGNEAAVLFGHSRRVEWIAFSPDGRYLVSGGADKCVRFWDLASRRTAAVLRLEQDVTAFALSPDAQLLATTGEDDKGLTDCIRIWNAGKVLAAGDSLDALPGRPDERLARATIEALGGRVGSEYDGSVTGIFFRAGLFDLPESYRFVNRDLKLLQRFPHLRSLALTHTQITDVGLAELRGLRELSDLDLSANPIGNVALKWLEHLPALEKLNLDDTQVTDAGLDHIAAMKKLTTVYLRDTRVTAEGVRRLKQRRTGLKVVGTDEKAKP
jgi:WD40 repeat protein